MASEKQRQEELAHLPHAAKEAKAKRQWIQVGEDTGKEVTVVNYRGKHGALRMEIDVYRADPVDPGTEPLMLMVPCPVCSPEPPDPPETMMIRKERKPFTLDGRWPGTLLTINDPIQCAACYRRGQSSPFKVRIRRGVATDA